MKVKPALSKQRVCYAMVWEDESGALEVSLLPDDQATIEAAYDGIRHQIEIEDPAKLERTVRLGIYKGVYFQSLFKTDAQQPVTIEEAFGIDSEVVRPLVAIDKFMRINSVRMEVGENGDL